MTSHRSPARSVLSPLGDAWEAARRESGSFIPTLSLLERFEALCFQDGHPFWLAPAQLSHLSSHGVLPLGAGELSLLMPSAAFDALLQRPLPDGLTLDLHAYGSPHAEVALRDGAAVLRLSAVEPDGLIRRAPPQSDTHDATLDDSWAFTEAEGHALEPLLAWCGRLQAPLGWERLRSNPPSKASAAPSLAPAPPPPALPSAPQLPPAVRPVVAYPSLDDGLRQSGQIWPFVVRKRYLRPAAAGPVPGLTAMHMRRGEDRPFHWVDGHTSHACYLRRGELFWWFVHPGDAHPDILSECTLTEILTADDYRLWGRVEILHQQAGDLVVFPASWSCRVRAYADATGLRGSL